jgi:hypothetical protein
VGTSGGASVATPTCYAALPIGWQPPTYRGHFEQMSLEDRLIWSRWLDHHAHAFDCYAYNVYIGGADCDQLDLPQPVKDQWRSCTAKRIDVLGWRRGRAWIIEVRYQAGVSAVGALLVYRHLFAEHNPNLPAPALLLLTDNIATDTARAARALGIAIKLLPG